MNEPNPTILPVDPEPVKRPAEAPLMHDGDLIRLRRLVEGLRYAAETMGNPSDLLRLHNEAEATHAAYAADHAARCLGCLPVPVERRRGPRPASPNTDRLITDALAAQVDGLTS